MNIKKITVVTAELTMMLLRVTTMLFLLYVIALLAISVFSKRIAKDIFNPAAVTSLCQQSGACMSGHLRTFDKADPNGWKPVFVLVRTEGDKAEFRKRELLDKASFMQRYFLKYARFEFRVTK